MKNDEIKLIYTFRPLCRDLGTNLLIFAGSEVKDIIDFQLSLPENNFYPTMTVGKKFLAIFGNNIRWFIPWIQVNNKKLTAVRSEDVLFVFSPKEANFIIFTCKSI